ncbi:hypothetical protein MMC09_003897 [Bachmanniomyces sp. S44760]|nr:hypothetical protein [Bachmanniomyces sp. S44760]
MEINSYKSTLAWIASTASPETALNDSILALRRSLPDLSMEGNAGNVLQRGDKSSTRPTMSTKTAIADLDSGLSGGCHTLIGRGPDEATDSAVNHDDNEDDLSEDCTDPYWPRREKKNCILVNGRQREQHYYQPWTTNMMWAYVTDDDDANQVSIDRGLTLYPQPISHVPDPAHNLRLLPAFKDTAAYLSCDSRPDGSWAMTDVRENNCILISPHRVPLLGDIRSIEGHPDHLPCNVLCEHQAFERAGFEVWRHDRRYHNCRLRTCQTTLSDHDVDTRICHGCGTKSSIRYCSLSHLLKDLVNHWKECGKPSTLIREYIDEATQPGRFWRRYPAIFDINGLRNYQLYRQRTHAIYNKGQYSLFLKGLPQLPEIIEWPQDMANIYKPRVERLLNLALFDQKTNSSLIEVLYRTLRFALRSSNKWNDHIKMALGIQFRMEFSFNSLGTTDEDPCPCEWYGDRVSDTCGVKVICNETCKKRFLRVGDLARGNGFQAYVEHMEAKHWILRVWRRQHPTVKNWQDRMFGIGFENVPTWQTTAEWRPAMGKGWDGFGARDDERDGIKKRGGLLWVKNEYANT